MSNAQDLDFQRKESIILGIDLTLNQDSLYPQVIAPL
jgi:hypothetical protein